MAFSYSILIPLLSLTILQLALLPHQSESATCTSQTLNSNTVYPRCLDLPTLNSYLHWSYDPTQTTLSVAFSAPPAKPDGWISWAINPTSTGMAGSQALVAFKDSTGKMTVQTYNVSSYGPLSGDGKVTWFDLKESSAEYVNGAMRLYAKLALPRGVGTRVNQVWQVGGGVTGGVPDRHEFQPANLNAKGSLDLLSGENSGGGGGGGAGGGDRVKKRNIHGVLNVVSWGIMFPIGIVIARYLRSFPSADPLWFYLHVFCQVSAYAIGVAGWGTGLKLGSQSKGITYSTHRNLGISLFALATVQIFALLLRPQKDHKYRFYWNIYHHGLGYSILVLGVINVFKGFDILNPEQKWRTSYIIIIACIGGFSVILEAATWILYLKREKSTKPYDGVHNNGHGR